MTDDTNRIQFHEGSLLLPPGFEDRTTNLFVPADTAKQPNLSVARDWLQEDESLSAYIDRQLAQLKKRMPGHQLLSRESEQLGSGETILTGERIDASYRNGDRTIRQRQAAFIVAPRRALILTAASPHPFDEAFETLWRDWLGGFQQPSADADDAVPG